MISVENALNIVKNNCIALGDNENISITEAMGRTLFENIASPINMPPFNQSAMDGYALNLNEEANYEIIGEVKAGDNCNPYLKPGQAVRIFTGAAVPSSANTVVMQEHVSITNQELSLESSVSLQDHIRPEGEQVTKGQTALKKGTKLTAAAIAFLTSLGITQIPVYKNPSIAIIVTGNELVKAGQSLAYGQIYESNSAMLLSALNNLGYHEVEIHQVEDDFELTFNRIQKLTNTKDLVLISGGISVGDYDFVGKALHKLEVIELFYRVKQKPGKPLFFGKIRNCILFALPGNPAAALSCFYIYVQTALQVLSGNSTIQLPKIKAKSVSEFTKKGERFQFLKAIYHSGNVEILEGQSSAMLQTFAIANALVLMPESLKNINIHDEVEVILLPLN